MYVLSNFNLITQLYHAPSHIKYCEPETDISCINANYRLVTPRDLPQMARGGLWGHHQALLGVLNLYFSNTMQIRS
jgi:hypothetical protein